MEIAGEEGEFVPASWLVAFVERYESGLQPSGFLIIANLGLRPRLVWSAPLALGFVPVREVFERGGHDGLEIAGEEESRFLRCATAWKCKGGGMEMRGIEWKYKEKGVNRAG